MYMELDGLKAQCNGNDLNPIKSKTLTARELRRLIQTSNGMDQTEALLKLLSIIEVNSRVLLELAANFRRETGRKPIEKESQVKLTSFLELH